MTPGLALALGCAATTGMACVPVLHRLPAPAEEPTSPYPRLASVGFAAAVALATLLAALVVAARAPQPWCWVWAGPLTAGTLAVAIDARTRYLPLRLSQAGWLVTTLGAAVATAVLGPTFLLRVVLAAAAAFALGWAAWRWAGFGFGDARLVAMLGAATGAHGWSVWWAGLLAGTLLGALAGVGVALRRGPDAAFPYGPALWAGAFVGLWVSG